MTTKSGKKGKRKSEVAQHLAQKTGTEPAQLALSWDKGENSPFCKLLRDIQAGREPIDALFAEPTFGKKLRLIIAARVENHEDAEELADDVKLKVWKSLSRFEPDYRHEYGNFFAWLRTIARNAFRDARYGRRNEEFIDVRAEDMAIIDPSVDVEASALHNELVAKFAKRINSLPLRERLAANHFVLGGLSSRETAEKLTAEGFPCTHASVLRWLRGTLTSEFFFPELVKPGKSNRQTRDRLPTARRVTESSLLKNLEFEFAALLASMQTSQSKRAVQASFEASPTKLGQSAVKHVGKKR